MENAGLISLVKWDFETAEAFHNQQKWAKASLVPLLMSSGYRMGIERWFSLEGKSVYRNSVLLVYFKDLESYLIDTHGSAAAAYRQDMQNTWGGKLEQSWRTIYLLARRFTGSSTAPIDRGNLVDKTTWLKEFTDDAPILLLRGLGLTPDEWEKYDTWVNEWGYDVYLPMLLKVPGIIEYSRFWLSNIGFYGMTPKPGVTENPDYPQDLSIFYFENLKSYQNFLKSKELAAFNQVLNSAFPSGLNYKWNSAYKLAWRWSR